MELVKYECSLGKLEVIDLKEQMGSTTSIYSEIRAIQASEKTEPKSSALRRHRSQKMNQTVNSVDGFGVMEARVAMNLQRVEDMPPAQQ